MVCLINHISGFIRTYLNFVRISFRDFLFRRFEQAPIILKL